MLMLFITASASVVVAKKRENPCWNEDKAAYFLLESIKMMKIDSPDSIVASFEILNRVLENDSLNSDALYRIAPYYIALNNHEQAYQKYLLAAKSSPANTHYNTIAANAAISIGDYVEAFSIYDELIKNDPNDENLYLMLASAYLNIGKVDKAMECYDKIESLTDNTEFVALTKAEIYSKLLQHNNELLEIKRLSEKYPDNIAYMMILASSYLSVDSLEKNREIISRVKELEGGCISALSDIEYYEKVGDEANLRLSLYQALECPENTIEEKKQILNEYLTLLLKGGDPSVLHRADTLFIHLTDSYPREVSIKKQYADILFLQKRYIEAIEQYHSAIYVNPNDIDTHKRLIEVLLYSKDYNAMNIAIKNAEQYADSTFVIFEATMYHMSHQAKKAIDKLKSSAEKYKESPIFVSEIYSFLADLYYQQGEVELSNQNYELAIKNNPNNIMAMNNYAYHLAQSGGDLDYAEKLSAKTIKESPDEPVYLDTYGWIFFKKGNYLFAELYIRKAIENSKEENPELLDHYGDVLFQQGKKDEAIEYWQKAIEAGDDREELKVKIKANRKTDKK